MCLLVVKGFYVLLSALICKQMAVTERYIRFGPKTWNCGCPSNQDQNQLINYIISPTPIKNFGPGFFHASEKGRVFSWQCCILIANYVKVTSITFSLPAPRPSSVHIVQIRGLQRNVTLTFCRDWLVFSLLPLRQID